MPFCHGSICEGHAGKGTPRSFRLGLMVRSTAARPEFFGGEREYVVFGAPAGLMAEISVPPQAWEDREVSDRIKAEVRSSIVASACPH
jgi:hypothetical protein